MNNGNTNFSNKLSYLFALSFVFMTNSAYAAGGGGLTSLTSMVTKLTTFISGPFGVAILTLVIMGAGLGAYFGSLEMKTVGKIALGSALIFGAANIANLLLS